MGLVLVGFAGAFGLVALVWANRVRLQRSGIFRITPLQVVATGSALLWIIGGFGGITWFFITLMKSEGDFPSMKFAQHAAVAAFALWAVVAAAILAANLQQGRAQRARNAETKALFEHVRGGQPLGQPLFVYLRPFSASGQKGTATERLVVELMEQRGTLLCVAESGFHYGMGRLPLRDDEWQPAVLEVCERATAIVIYPAATAGTLWELSQLIIRRWLDRTFFFMPPNVPFHRVFSWAARFGDSQQRAQLEKYDIRSTWDQVRAGARGVGVDLPGYRDEGGLFRITAGEAAWVTAFGHEYLIGKPPALERQELDPILDALIAKWRAANRP